MFCDANVILRYILEDHQDYFVQAVEIIEDKPVFIAFEVMAEVVYVLEKVYKLSRQEVVNPLLCLIDYPNISTTASDVAKYSLDLFVSTNLDFVDCLLCGYSKIRHEDIATFDKKMLKYINQNKKSDLLPK